MNQAPNTGVANINGADIYYERKGSGDSLLLIHAGVADSRMFDRQFDLFAQSYQVIRFDLRGFGRSNMPSGKFANHEDVRALLGFLDIKKANVLGISFGGLIALDFALAHAKRVKSLILGAPSISGVAPSDRIRQFWQEEDAALENDDVAAATELNLRLWVDGLQRTPDQVDPQVREQVGEMQTAAFLKEIPDDVESIDLDPPANGRLGELQMPVFILVGDQDLPEKVSLAEESAEKIRDCQITILPSVGHMLNMEKPGQFNQQVLDFLSNQ